ncbi:hypothetical protein D3C85_1137810 [compost metagenome]
MACTRALGRSYCSSRGGGICGTRKGGEVCTGKATASSVKPRQWNTTSSPAMKSGKSTVTDKVGSAGPRSPSSIKPSASSGSTTGRGNRKVLISTKA